jgi:hypothetical protein
VGFAEGFANCFASGIAIRIAVVLVGVSRSSCFLLVPETVGMAKKMAVMIQQGNSKGNHYHLIYVFIVN